MSLYVEKTKGDSLPVKILVFQNSRQKLSSRICAFPLRSLSKCSCAKVFFPSICKLCLIELNRRALLFVRQSVCLCLFFVELVNRYQCKLTSHHSSKLKEEPGSWQQNKRANKNSQTKNSKKANELLQFYFVSSILQKLRVTLSLCALSLPVSVSQPSSLLAFDARLAYKFSLASQLDCGCQSWYQTHASFARGSSKQRWRSQQSGALINLQRQ